MAEVIIMPKLGFNMDEGRLVTWCVKPGEAVKKGELLFEIETDKTVMPVQATHDGILLKTLLQEGEAADVFTPIAVVGQSGEDADAALSAFDGKSSAPTAPAQETAEPLRTDAVAQVTTTANLRAFKLTPKAKKLIRDEGIALSSLSGIQGTGFEGGITAKDIKAASLNPAAQKDTESAASRSGAAASNIETVAGQFAETPLPTDKPEKQILSTTPYQGVRKVIGERLTKSVLTAPHIFFIDSVDTTNLTTFRRQLNENGDVKITVSDLLVLAASKSLQKYPDVNVSLAGGQIVSYRSTNIGVAVAGERGLLVPVVKNVQEKTLFAIAAETRVLVEKAKLGRLAPEEMSDGTFTISNLGMFGIESFTAIINPPESAILAVSSVRKTPVVVTGEDGRDSVAIRPMMKIQLSADHRVIDGLLAAQFVAYYKALLENPALLLI